MALFKSGSKNNERSSIDNAAKTLLANIRFISVDNPVRTIVFTSAVPNEGKTFVTSNLANAIATSGKSVLLVECDMRRRSMAHQLGVHAQHGLYSVLSGEVGLSTASVETDTPNFYFLDAEPHIPNPSDMINSERFSRFIELAASMYDYVVFDTPPVGTFVDAAVLGAKVDAVFLVVRENFAKKAEVAAAAEQLRKAGCNLAGIVMNYCERRDSEYYYEYYYKEGATDGKSSGSDSRNPLSKAASAARKAVPSRPERRSSASSSDSGSSELPQRPARPARKAATPATPAVPAEEKVSSATDMDLFAPPSKAIETETRPASATEHHPSAASLPAIEEPRAMSYSSASAPAASTPAASTSSASDDRIMDTGIYASLAARAREERAEQQAAQQAAFDEQKTGDLSSASHAASRSVNPYIVRRSSEDYY